MFANLRVQLEADSQLADAATPAPGSGPSGLDSIGRAADPSSQPSWPAGSGPI